MTVRIKNWSQFQHFKDRRPPWVKLYRDLLDDMEWHQLEPRAAKTLVMLWLIASEKDGELPEAKELAFRLRCTERVLLDTLMELSHWLEQDDIAPISSRYQSDAPETEERQRRERDRPARFEKFWAACPKKAGKGAAEKAFVKVDDVPLETLLTALAQQAKTEQWLKDGGRYIPHPATWLNEKRWLDSLDIGPETEWHERPAEVEAMGLKLGLGLWVQTEQYLDYKARVMTAYRQGAH